MLDILASKKEESTGRWKLEDKTAAKNSVRDRSHWIARPTRKSKALLLRGVHTYMHAAQQPQDDVNPNISPRDGANSVTKIPCRPMMRESQLFLTCEPPSSYPFQNSTKSSDFVSALLSVNSMCLEPLKRCILKPRSLHKRSRLSYIPMGKLGIPHAHARKQQAFEPMITPILIICKSSRRSRIKIDHVTMPAIYTLMFLLSTVVQ